MTLYIKMLKITILLHAFTMQAFSLWHDRLQLVAWIWIVLMMGAMLVHTWSIFRYIFRDEQVKVEQEDYMPIPFLTMDNHLACFPLRKEIHFVHKNIQHFYHAILFFSNSR